jgi:hypothetical protein
LYLHKFLYLSLRLLPASDRICSFQHATTLKSPARSGSSTSSPVQSKDATGPRSERDVMAVAVSNALVLRRFEAVPSAPPEPAAAAAGPAGGARTTARLFLLWTGMVMM